jgi:hypothetical protein
MFSSYKFINLQHKSKPSIRQGFLPLRQRKLKKKANENKFSLLPLSLLPTRHFLSPKAPRNLQLLSQNPPKLPFLILYPYLTSV